MDFYQENDPITAFWKWFHQNHNLIKEVLDAEDTHPAKFSIVNALDNHILGFGKFKWLVEYGEQKDLSFIISPNGDEKLLEISKKVIEAAPHHLDTWEFHPAKPAKNWNLQFNIYDDQMYIQQIDATDWRFVLMPQRGGKTAIIVEAPNIAHLKQGVQKNATNMLLNNLIGEEIKILKVADFLIIKELSQNHQDQSHPIQNIYEEFSKMIH